MRFALVSICQKIVQGPVILAFFHYHGFFAGKKIKRIMVQIPLTDQSQGQNFWAKGESYLLYLEVDTINGNLIESRFLYGKKISEVYRE